MTVSHIPDASVLTGWRKSTRSNTSGGDCVEVTASYLPPRDGGWRKSSYSGADNNSCVEVADGLGNVVPVRDSKDPHGPALLFSADAWGAFVAGVKAREFPAA